jgi:hypothetical protein
MNLSSLNFEKCVEKKRIENIMETKNCVEKMNQPLWKFLNFL